MVISPLAVINPVGDPVLNPSGLQAGFTPLNLGSDLVAWGNSSSSVGFDLTGSAVNSWRDLSGNGNDLTQGTAADKPTYDSTNKRVVFDGVSDFISIATFTQGALPQPNTTWIVFEYISIGGLQFLQDGATATTHALADNATNFLANNGTATDILVASNTNKNIYVGVWDGAISQGYINGGTDLITINIGATALTGFVLGADNAGANFSNVNVYEWGITDDVLTSAKINQIGNYLISVNPGTSWTDIA